MYGLHEDLARERSAEWQRRASGRRLGDVFAAARRARRRAAAAGRGAAVNDARAAAIALAARSEYELVGH